MPHSKRSRAGLGQEPFWYKSGVIYEVHVRAFYDADGDGAGDFRGLTEKLDYIKDLGVTAIWLLPFYPSPLKDDGYDIADYCGVHPMYGTLGDFKIFLREAHRRGLRVITELVLNHTSDQHPWFQRARRAKPGSRWRNFYVWSDDAEQIQGHAASSSRTWKSRTGRWDPVAKAYFWHRFFSHQPDLNYDNPEVHEAMFKVVDFWLDLGVDGLRLDAVPYLYEREGTNCENLPETHAFLKKLRAHVDEKYGDRMLLAEANQWPEDAVTYFGQGRGDECHMAFHFPLMPRLFMALRMEDRLPIVEILRADAADSRNQPVGAVPAQPRRADPGNGHRRGARLHVSDVCAGASGAAQSGHPPPPRAVAGQRPQEHRTAQRPALLAARHAGALLRRRNRPGRKHLSRRPQRRAHADAVEFGQKRRLFPRQSAEPLPADHPRPGLPLRSRATWRRNWPIRIRCSGGCGGCWRCANAGARSARANANFSSRTTTRF